MSAALIRSGVKADLNADLNDAQRAAVEHGVGDPDGPAPLHRHRRRRRRQDQHARPPRRAPHPQRRRSQAHHARDVFAARRGGAQPARPAPAAAPAACGNRGARHARLRRDLPFDRRASASRICRAHRPRPQFHHPRPRRFGRSDELCPPRGGFFGEGRALSHQGDVPGHLFTGRQRARIAGDDAGEAISLGRQT